MADAFDGSEIAVVAQDGVFDLRLRQPGMLRPLRTAELSDGTLRYLLWATALLTVDPPSLMVFNEPETSLHPELLPPLARLIRRSAERTQTLVVSHSRTLIDGLDVRRLGEEDDDVDLEARRLEIELAKDLGETRILGQGLMTTPPWNWGTR